jgi:Uroporphyrinogen decarboxylase (URO-D)
VTATENSMPETNFGPRAQLALDAIRGKIVRGIPTGAVNVMEWGMIDRLAGCPEGSYRRDPIATYRDMLERVGVCMVGQWIPENPLSMGSAGYEDTQRGATTGAESIVCDGMVIDSPEAVVEHLERVEFPRLQGAAENFDEERRAGDILAGEAGVQQLIGPNMLKTGYGFIHFPSLAYTRYGYEAYFMAFALYPEVIERHFALQADVALRNNRAAARAYREGRLPPTFRLDHDMADSRGTLVNVKALDRMWFPHFARCLEPVLKTDVKLIWHCDGNLMQMVPRLLEVGLSGFQGFQYEDGMDYERICRMKTRDGEGLFIMAGVSVTRTLPMGKPADVKREMAWLVEHGPSTGLTLGASSSITPGVPWENLETLVEGFGYYRKRGREIRRG